MSQSDVSEERFIDDEAPTVPDLSKIAGDERDDDTWGRDDETDGEPFDLDRLGQLDDASLDIDPRDKTER